MLNKNLFVAKMKEKGFTQEMLATESGVSRATINRIIAEDRCSINSARKLAKALGLTSKEAGAIFFGAKIS